MKQHTPAPAAMVPMAEAESRSSQSKKVLLRAAARGDLEVVKAGTSKQARLLVVVASLDAYLAGLPRVGGPAAGKGA